MARRPVRNFAPDAARRARVKLGRTQEGVADDLGIERTYYVAIENGQRQLGPANLRRLAEVLQVHPQQLTTTRKSDATLRDLREWAGLTQAQVAARFGARSTSRISALERGAYELTNDDLAVLEVAYDVSPAQLRKAWARGRDETDE